MLVTTAVRCEASRNTGHRLSLPAEPLAAAASSTGTQLPPQSGVRMRSVPTLQKQGNPDDSSEPRQH